MGLESAKNKHNTASTFYSYMFFPFVPPQSLATCTAMRGGICWLFIYSIQGVESLTQKVPEIQRKFPEGPTRWGIGK